MIKSMPYLERPREKMLNLGRDHLSNSELLAIMIRTGSKDKSAVDLAKQVIDLCEHNISDLRGLTIEMLQQIDGIGPSKACQIIAGIELGMRIQTAPLNVGQKIGSPKDIVDFVASSLRNEKKEHFIVVFLSTKNTIIGQDVISIGSLNASIVHPREVFNVAIKRHAASIIAIHNHPSGDTSPSKEDVLVTERLSEAGKLIGIELLDHIIIGHESYYSFKEHHAI